METGLSKEEVKAAYASFIQQLPEHLRKSLREPTCHGSGIHKFKMYVDNSGSPVANEIANTLMDASEAGEIKLRDKKVLFFTQQTPEDEAKSILFGRCISFVEATLRESEIFSELSLKKEWAPTYIITVSGVHKSENKLWKFRALHMQGTAIVWGKLMLAQLGTDEESADAMLRTFRRST